MPDDLEYGAPVDIAARWIGGFDPVDAGTPADSPPVEDKLRRFDPLPARNLVAIDPDATTDEIIAENPQPPDPNEPPPPPPPPDVPDPQDQTEPDPGSENPTP